MYWIDEPVSRSGLNETPNDPEQEKERAAEPQRGNSLIAFLMPALSTDIPLDLAGNDWITSNYDLGERQYGVIYCQCTSQPEAD